MSPLLTSTRSGDAAVVAAGGRKPPGNLEGSMLRTPVNRSTAFKVRSRPPRPSPPSRLLRPATAGSRATELQGVPDAIRRGLKPIVIRTAVEGVQLLGRDDQRHDTSRETAPFDPALESRPAPSSKNVYERNA